MIKYECHKIFICIKIKLYIFVWLIGYAIFELEYRLLFSLILIILYIFLYKK
jgi:hypothetical protein